MRTISRLTTISFLLVALTACTSVHKPVPPPKVTETASSIPTGGPTQVVLSADLAFSAPLVQVLRAFGLSITSVQSSTYAAMFPSTGKAVWIKTNMGIVEAVFFADAAEVKQIHITEQPNKATGRYLYIIQAHPPTLEQDQTIDAAFPLYFTTRDDMLIITSSEELDKVLRKIFSGR